MTNWNFQPPENMPKGRHVFVLVVYTETKELGTRPMEAAEACSNWDEHVFAWQPIEEPTFTIEDAARVHHEWQKNQELKDYNAHQCCGP